VTLKIRAATALYRWQLSSSIVSVLFSALTFIGVFAVLGLPWYQLLLVVLTVIFGTGFLLDRVLKFWQAQATVATVRNQYLVDTLYQKEMINLKSITLPQLEALRLLLTFIQFPNEPRYADARNSLVLELDGSISRVRDAVDNRKWKIEPGEDVYGH